MHRRRATGTGLHTLPLVLGLSLLSPPAYALPGPVILLPLALGSLPFLVAMASLLLGRGWSRRSPLLLYVAAAVAGFLVGKELGAMAALLGVFVWRRPRRRGLPAALLLTTAGILGSLYLDNPDLPPLPMLPESDVLRSPPVPAFPVSELAAGGALVLHVGEAEEFSNCRAAAGYLIRPADLESRSDQLKNLVAAGPVVALAAEGTELASRLERLGIRVFSLQKLSSPSVGVLCFAPRGDLWWRALTTGLSRIIELSDVPGADLAGAPRLRAGDASTVASRVLSAAEILEVPTGRLVAEGLPIIVAGDDLALTAAAVRLWRAARGTVLATISAAPASSRPALDARGSLFVVLILTILSILSVRCLRALGERRWIDLLVGRSTSSPFPSPHLAALVLAVVAAVLADGTAVSPGWGLLVTPMTWGGSGWLAVASLGGAALAWQLAFGRDRILRWGLVFVLPALAAGIADGPLPLPLHLLAAIPVLLAPSLDERWPRTRRALVELRFADRVPWSGGKARRLARAVRLGVPVPPGVVLRPDGASVSLLRARFPGTPLILRSSAPDEDDSPATAGRFLTQSWAPDEPPELLESRLREVAAACAGAVLVMPRVASTASGVVATDVAGGALALLEEGPGTDGVTAGSSTTTCHWLGRYSGKVRSDGPGSGATHARAIVQDVERCGAHGGEWLLVAGTHVLVQLRPAGSTPPAPRVPDGAHEALALLGPDEWLERVDADGLPDPAPRDTLELWASLWTRETALGDAFQLLGLPRFLAPRRALLVLGGRLYSPSRARCHLALVALLKNAPRRLGHALKRFSHATPIEDPRLELRRLAALSIALRLVRPALRGDPARELVSRELAAALEAGDLSAWPHRATFDLDPATPRFGASIPAPRPLPSLEGPPNLATCDVWADHVLDQLARVVALLHCERSYWGPLPHVAATRDRYPIEILESGDDLEPPAPGEPRGVWVSGEGPLEGVVSFEPRQGAIWVVQDAPPVLAARWKGCAAVVSTRGGPLSHLAMVARAESFPALFTARNLEHLAEGEHLRIDSDGRITLERRPVAVRLPRI